MIDQKNMCGANGAVWTENYFLNCSCQTLDDLKEQFFDKLLV